MVKLGANFAESLIMKYLNEYEQEQFVRNELGVKEFEARAKAYANVKDHFEFANEMGLNALEFTMTVFNDELYPRKGEIKKIKRLSEEYDISVSLHSPIEERFDLAEESSDYRRMTVRHMKRYIGDLFFAEVVVVHPGKGGVNEAKEYGEGVNDKRIVVLDRLVESLKELKKTGVRLGLENGTAYTPVSDVADVNYVIPAVNEDEGGEDLTFIPDPGHVLTHLPRDEKKSITNQRVIDIVQKLRPYIKTVEAHIADYKPGVYHCQLLTGGLTMPLLTKYVTGLLNRGCERFILEVMPSNRERSEYWEYRWMLEQSIAQVKRVPKIRRLLNV